MKKNIIKVFIFLIFALTLTGCDTEQNIIIDDTPTTNEDETISRNPSLQEIKEACDGNYQRISEIADSFKDKSKSLANLDIKQVLALIKDVYSTYGDDLPNLQSDGKTYIYNNVADIAILSTFAYSKDEGPILVIKNANISGLGNVNVVLLSGTQLKSGQATGIKEDIYSGMELSNEFLYDAYYVIKDNLDPSVPLVIGGVSLGGMVAQQLAALPNLKNLNYTVKNVIAIGSPMLNESYIDYTTTTVRRMVDVDDVVPTLSVNYNGSYDCPYETCQGKNIAVVRDHPKYTTFVGTHIVGYTDKTTWNGIDVLGYENGNNTLTFTKDNMEWFEAQTYENGF